MREGQEEASYKVIIIGKSGVGKSTLLIRFLEDKFVKQVATVAVDYQFKEVQYKQTKFKLDIWDTAGQERYRTMVKNYFHLSKAAFIVFDLDDISSLDDAAVWLQELAQQCGKDIPKLLLGNKCDMLNPAELNETLESIQSKIDKLKSEHKCQLEVVSGRSGENTHKAFDRLVELIYKQYLEKKIENKRMGSKLNEMGKKHEEKGKKGCC